ncbi:MAG: GTPase Der [Alphaproteobacteria bacterium MarineAlpha10_Bin3]|nr:MAG: GTPase Der [Alphaproteobacteria bacterium MarineAlpha10_Bin3]PPR75015.1 MAG: GTPase Der [Alphaproteobacteria bacterium MarineAlpha4_Bin1]
MTFTVAIVGRPNVGKSTLFNRLVGKRLALVDDTPGVTRDRRVGAARLGDMSFDIVDTAGLEEAFDDSLEARMRRQTDQAIDDADVALLLIDAREGVTPLDNHFAAWLRRLDTPVILVANKCEGKAASQGYYDSYALGLGDPIALSAEHGEGMADLFEVLRPYHDLTQGEGEETAPPILQLAIVGRPNVGKSTLINRLIGEDRLLTGPEAGITRDSIALDWSYRGRPLKLVDTAGMRRRARINEKLERLSGADARRAIRYAQVVALLLDATDMLEKQDLAIARHTIDEGRALVIVVNKWDLIDDKNAALARLRDRLERSMPQVRGVPVVTVSALTGRNLDRMLDATFAIYDVWKTRIETAKLNEWLGYMLAAHPPPLVAGRRIRLRYMTQIKTRPPTFAFWTTRPDAVPDSYMRYLMNGLRTDFDLAGVPLRLLLRKGRNPYAGRANTKGR